MLFCMCLQVWKYNRLKLINLQLFQFVIAILPALKDYISKLQTQIEKHAITLQLKTTLLHS